MKGVLIKPSKVISRHKINDNIERSMSPQSTLDNDDDQKVLESDSNSDSAYYSEADSCRIKNMTLNEEGKIPQNSKHEPVVHLQNNKINVRPDPIGGNEPSKRMIETQDNDCLLYTSDAADE